MYSATLKPQLKIFHVKSKVRTEIQFHFRVLPFSLKACVIFEINRRFIQFKRYKQLNL